MLTDAEHRALALTEDLYEALTSVVSRGPGRAADLASLATHVHAIQALVMAQAAARAYPDRYRLLGDGP